MKLSSDIKQDVRHSAPQPGGYEWWYFDGLSDDGRHSFVIIFYRGNPFSTRYISRLRQNKKPVPADFPALSISVYEDDEPIYYSFTEYKPENCAFSKDFLSIRLKNHTLKGQVKDEKLIYQLNLNEKLPSGHALKSNLTFSSSVPGYEFQEYDASGAKEGHLWNLMQPAARAEGRIKVSVNHQLKQEIQFRGQGYHDHNTGDEPMRNEFEDWYWGRLHFEYATLVFYVMNRQTSRQHHAWLIRPDNSAIMAEIEQAELQDKGFTLFGLSPARKLQLDSDKLQIQIQHSHLLDNGPFYRRYRSDGILQMDDQNLLETTSGISEYIYPNRIHQRLFWPLVKMRIRSALEGSHWVQRFKSLYEWTW